MLSLELSAMGTWDFIVTSFPLLGGCLSHRHSALPLLRVGNRCWPQAQEDVGELQTSAQAL